MWPEWQLSDVVANIISIWLQIIIIAIIISGFIRKPELDNDEDETEKFEEELKALEKENLQITNKILGN